VEVLVQLVQLLLELVQQLGLGLVLVRPLVLVLVLVLEQQL
jgi:hypothetical protein